jgi:transcriptional regulator
VITLLCRVLGELLAGVAPEHGVPTSYYAAVQFIAKPTVIDEPEQKLDALRRQMADFDTDADVAALADEAAPFLRMLPGLRALRLEVLEVVAKFKFDDHKSVEFRQAVSAKLVERAQATGHCS